MLEKYQQFPFWQKLLAVVAIVLIAGFLFYNYSYKEKEEEMERLERQLNSLMVENAEARKMEQELPNLEAKIRALEFDLQHLSEILPTEREAETFLASLYQRALSNNLLIPIYEKRPDTPYQEYLIKIPMRYEATGSYHDLRRFFEALAQATQIVNIINLDLQIETRRTGRTINAKFDLTTFRFVGDDMGIE